MWTELTVGTFPGLHGFERGTKAPRRRTMRNAMLAMLVLLSAGLVTVASSGPAAAYDYPWCAQGRQFGIPGECAYQTYAQCQASVSGRDLYCNINPRVALRPPPAPGYPRRYYRDYYRD
jgi:hypothetical protein